LDLNLSVDLIGLELTWGVEE